MITPNLQTLLDALRSGEYKQGTGQLTRSIGPTASKIEEHCCLGLGSKLAADADVCVRAQSEGATTVIYDTKSFYLPPSVASWFGVSTYTFSDDTHDLFAVIKGTDGAPKNTRASILNDQGYTFEYIADAIEAYYKDND